MKKYPYAVAGRSNFAVVLEPPNYDCHASATFGLTHTIALHYSTLLKFGGANYSVVGVLLNPGLRARTLTYAFTI